MLSRAHAKSSTLRWAVMAFICLIAFEDKFYVNANGVDGEYYLHGVGYREQELQVAKGTKFASEEPKGI